MVLIEECFYEPSEYQKLIRQLTHIFKKTPADYLSIELDIELVKR